MPLFQVTKGQDAYVNYTAIIEADNEAEAVVLAEKRDFRNGDHWLPTGVTNEFDDAHVFEDMAELVVGDDMDAAKAALAEEFDGQDHWLSSGDRDTILVALRFYQSHLETVQLSDELMDIATNGGSHPAYDAEAIDELCETINV